MSDFGTKDCATIIALVLGPAIAVTITLLFQRRAEKRSAKERLFAELMAHRRSNPPAIEWANALNLIDIVFQDNKSVVNKWHEAFGLINRPADQINWGQWGHAHIELLSEIALVLGYKRLQQTDIDRFYAPQAQWDQAALTHELQIEFLRVLKASQTVGTPRA
jgi:hypothetical protein